MSALVSHPNLERISVNAIISFESDDSSGSWQATTTLNLMRETYKPSTLTRRRPPPPLKRTQ